MMRQAIVGICIVMLLWGGTLLSATLVNSEIHKAFIGAGVFATWMVCGIMLRGIALLLNDKPKPPKP